MCKQSNLLYALLVFLFACTNSDKTPVPKQHAYPRMLELSKEYSNTTQVPFVSFDINSDARLINKENGCDIVYDKLNATVYISVINGLNTPEKFNQTWSNRVQRIDRNLGGITKNTTQVNNNGFEGVVIVSQSVCQTPVQMLAADTNTGIIVSATAFMHNNIPINTYDSIAPFYNALAADITHLAQSLKCK